ncbi:unknown [Prevotella sp. CAG:5226]|nr:unknown [Prevotella sp. CAG:5226]
MLLTHLLFTTHHISTLTSIASKLACKRFAHSAASGNFVHIALNCTK